ncbi:GTP cyclohydrolase II RibA [Aureimonas frigidaquae]|uniref:GTP cyclohydrolase-2 n=1 Tax=Aureimonas frigidaquae TaxID=424757 RepID=A0A0P0Z3U5_9HYPH|nr:GTP cyclohydrolase II RibA [Aureimonas frigidaquae]BAT28780.1 GTP cyclohydrolase [Aureimonas frigidaquae]
MNHDRAAANGGAIGKLVFGTAGTLRAERAVAELRAGRPVMLRRTEPKANRAILALDTASPAVYEAFMAATLARAELYLTPARAHVLGLDAPEGARVPLTGLNYDALCQIGYLRHAATPSAWRPGDALDAEAAHLARLALLLPAVLVADVAEEDPLFLSCNAVEPGDLSEGFSTAALSFNEIARTPVPLKDVGEVVFAVFRGGFAQRDQLAIIVGAPDPTSAVPVRIHSSCITGDLFGSLKCDCGDQLRNGLSILKEMGGGVLLYLDQEGRGTGIASKMRAYGLQHEGLDTVDADAELGFGGDERRYEAAVAILKALKIGTIRLLTNNPSKIAYLRGSGLCVEERIPVEGAVTGENENYLRTKVRRAGHLMDVDAMTRRP